MVVSSDSVARMERSAIRDKPSDPAPPFPDYGTAKTRSLHPGYAPFLRLIWPATIPQSKFHGSEPQRAQQLGDGGQQLGRRQGFVVVANDRVKSALLAV